MIKLAKRRLPQPSLRERIKSLYERGRICEHERERLLAREREIHDAMNLIRVRVSDQVYDEFIRSSGVDAVLRVDDNPLTMADWRTLASCRLLLDEVVRLELRVSSPETSDGVLIDVTQMVGSPAA